MIIPEKYKDFYNFLLKSNKIVDYENFDEEILHIFSHKVLEKITEGNTEWEKMVPPIIARLIKENNLFNYRKQFKKTNNKFI